MRKSGKKAVLVLGCALTLSLGVGIAVASAIDKPAVAGDAEVAHFTMKFASDNGVISDTDYGASEATNLDARSSDSKGATYEVDVKYLGAKASSGNYAILQSGTGYVKLATPLYNIGSIKVVTSAAAGEAKISWGATDACADGSSTTVNGNHPVTAANYFKIESLTAEVTITSIEVTYGCKMVDGSAESDWSDLQVIELNLGGISKLGEVGKTTGAFRNIVYMSTSAAAYNVTPTMDSAIMTVNTSSTYTFVYAADGTWTSNNQGQGSTSATLGLSPVSDGVLSLHYYVSSESGYDELHIPGSGEAFSSSSGTSGDVTSTFTAGSNYSIYYEKDSSGNRGDDEAILSKMTYSPDALPDGVTFPVLSFDTDGGSAVDPILAVSGFSISNMPTEIPTKSGSIFKGWFSDAACTAAFDPTAGISASTTVYAKWAAARTVTFYVDGEVSSTQVVEDGATLTLPANPTKAGYIFDNWCTDAACTVDYVAGAVTSDFSLYAKFHEAPFYVGSFTGYEIYKPNSVGNPNIYSSATTLTIDATLGVTVGSTSRGTFTYNDVTKEGSTDSGSPFYIDSEIAITNYSNSSTDRFGNDIYLFNMTSQTFSIDKAVSLSSTSVKWLVQYTIGGTAKVLYLDNPNSKVYKDVTITDISGNAVTVAGLYASSAFTSSLKIAQGSTVIEQFGLSSGALVALDGYQGTYTGNIDSVATSLALDGAGVATLGGSAATYKVLGTNSIKVSLNGRGYTLSVDASAFTYAQAADGLAKTYTGASGDLVLAGDGTCTLNAVAGVYDYNGTIVTVTIGSTVTAMGVDTTAGTYALNSKFAGLTFTGTYIDNYSDSTKLNIVFAENDGSAIHGVLYSGYGTTYYFNFTAVLSETTLTFTFGTCIDSSQAGKTMAATISGDTMTITSCTISNGAYSFANSGSATCSGFSL